MGKKKCVIIFTGNLCHYVIISINGPEILFEETGRIFC